MRPVEKGFLLLSCSMGDPQRKILTTAQLRTLARRMRSMPLSVQQRELALEDITSLGYDKAFAQRILHLLSQDDLLTHYLRRAEKMGCVGITRISDQYPLILRRKLGEDAPACLWTKGDRSLLNMPAVSLVGSRDLRPDNCRFAEEVGRQAARQGYVLISGNARGADRTAQDACMNAGGKVISVVADSLAEHSVEENKLLISEHGFDEEFSAARALSRNRLIHAMGQITFVAQCTYDKGGTWDGTTKNLRFGWSPVFCYSDGSEAAEYLIQMGAQPVATSGLQMLEKLQANRICFFDQ